MKKRKLKMRRLIDKWTPIVFILFCLVKTLQFFKNLGFTPKHSGWRSAMNAFSRAEHSKFILAVFHLDIFSDISDPKPLYSFDWAANHLVERLRSFLKTRPESHWQLIWKRFRIFRKKKKNVDIVIAQFSVAGNLLSIDPRLDPDNDCTVVMSDENCSEINQKIVDIYNSVKNMADKKRPQELEKQIKKWARSKKDIIKAELYFYLQYINRVLSGIFIHFDRLDESGSLEDRFADPPFMKMKHPGHGLLNIHCRFAGDFKEADLWFEFHHVAVDGVPMQGILNDLKKSWGVTTKLTFPSVKEESIVVNEISSTTEKKNPVYQAKQFINFRPFLDIREELNRKHAEELGFSITAGGMLMWGLAHHKTLYDKKFMFTCEMPEVKGKNQERAPGLIIIRPNRYFTPENPREGFLKFQRVLDERFKATRERRSESYELMESYALTTPIIYNLIQKMFPKSFAEFVGTVGITMIRGSDHFMTPLSDINTDGFLAFGNFNVPTEDGSQAGVVTARGSKSQVKDYLLAVGDVVSDFNKYC